MTTPQSPSDRERGEERRPALRASDDEREQAVTRLRQAATDGRLTLEELSERLERALGAMTGEELDAVTADLPAVDPLPTQRRGRRWIVAIMGGDDFKGRWRIAPRCTIVNVMGGADLDLREALIEAHETEITVVSVMGGSDIVVPDGVEVELGGFAFMGGNDLDLKGHAPRPGAPVVRVRAFSFLGGTDVKTKSAGGAGDR